MGRPMHVNRIHILIYQSHARRNIVFRNALLPLFFNHFIIYFDMIRVLRECAFLFDIGSFLQVTQYQFMIAKRDITNFGSCYNI